MLQYLHLLLLPEGTLRDACIGGDPMMGDCLNVSAYTYSIVSVDPNDGETELETFASATIENAMYGEGIRFEITDSATTS